MLRRQVVARISGSEISDFRRACQLLGKSQSAILTAAVRAAIKQAQKLYPREFSELTSEEYRVLSIIRAGNWTRSEIIARTHLTAVETDELLASLQFKRKIEVTIARVSGSESMLYQPAQL